jgi:hypothetical protein
VNELQAGIEQSLAVFPESAVFLQPGKAAFNHPAPQHDLQAVQLAAFGYLHPDVLAQNFSHTLRERLTDIASVTQQALYLA